jgi:hypothetical protein
VRGIGCADCLRDLRDCAESCSVYCAEDDDDCHVVLVGPGGGVAPATGQAGGGVLASGSQSPCHSGRRHCDERCSVRTALHYCDVASL